MQLIRFEFADLSILTASVVATINQLALDNPDSDIRVTDDGNSNIKVYAGPLNAETHRYWVYLDGRIILKEEDVSPEDGALGAWQVVLD